MDPRSRLLGHVVEVRPHARLGQSLSRLDHAALFVERGGATTRAASDLRSQHTRIAANEMRDAWNFPGANCRRGLLE
ncbi:hypothetical protein [Nannocystis punicea]|uniref:Uncharacterized protein n=1 Tax=Nannocystis punicea TaxID=2995304 RepID=A0ABY7H1U9_9BACT|nr:hypothetical protein [Nannocystis poenicansa]WAS93238.1 hypothetical protein O0S08_44325 [Nannocystis poenicansa]